MSYEPKPGDKVLVEGVVQSSIDDAIAVEFKTWSDIKSLHFKKESITKAPEFKYGEEVEVSCAGMEWRKRIFLADLGEKCDLRYKTVCNACEQQFKNGKAFEDFSWSQCRKIQKPTQEEIEKAKKVLEDAGVIKDGKVLEG